MTVRVGVLVMAHGTPDTPEGIEAFYTRIRRGRPPTPELLAELTGRYQAIGGTSPLTARTRAQVDGLAAALEATDPGRYVVELGTKFVDPTIEDGMAGLAGQGVDRVIGIVLTPHQSTMGSGEYFRRAELAAAGADTPLPLAAIPSWHRSAEFAPLLAARTRDALDGLDPAARTRTAVFFTAHSLPERAVADGDPYPGQVADSGADIAALLDLDADATVSWGTAWQSAGRTADPWIGPDLLVEMERVAAEGATVVVVCPVGFVSDHLEVLYDLDIEAQAKADALGIAFARTSSLNDDPAFLAMLASVVRAADRRTVEDGAGIRHPRVISASDPTRPVIAVVGGGMAGLSAAWELSRPRDGGPVPHVVVLEAGSRPGGKVRSAEFCDRTVDVAADAFLARRPEATELCDELGLSDALVSPGASGASLWVRGRLRMMPDGMNLGVPTRAWPTVRSGILGPAGLLRATLDLVTPHRGKPRATADRSVGDIVGARLGHEVVERLVDPLVGGINAGGVADLSAEATFPPLLSADRQSGSLIRALRRPPSPGQTPPAPKPVPGAVPSPVFWSLDGGTARLPAELATALTGRGVAVHTGVAVESLTRLPDDGTGSTWRLALAGAAGGVAGSTGSSESVRVLDVDGVVLAVPAGQAAGLLADHAPLASSLLGDIDYASVAVVTLSLPSGSARRPMSGTGFLVPRTSTIGDRPALITGCTYLTRKWPGLARPGDDLVRLSVGRHGDPRPGSLDDDELTAATVAELTAVLDIDAAPHDFMVTRWDDAFPQYRVGHLARTSAIEQAVAALPGVAVAGAAYRGVGIPAVVGSGRAVGRSVVRSLAGTAPARPGR